MKDNLERISKKEFEKWKNIIGNEIKLIDEDKNIDKQEYKISEYINLLYGLYNGLDFIYRKDINKKEKEEFFKKYEVDDLKYVNNIHKFYLNLKNMYDHFKDYKVSKKESDLIRHEFKEINKIAFDFIGKYEMLFHSQGKKEKNIKKAIRNISLKDLSVFTKTYQRLHLLFEKYKN